MYVPTFIRRSRSSVIIMRFCGEEPTRGAVFNVFIII